MNVCVRRVNEWDAPAMLKIYAEAIEDGLSPHEREVPELSEFVRRVDRYTYSRGWTLADVDGRCAGFAVAHECLDAPDDPYLLDVEVYVLRSMRRCGVGSAVAGLIRDLAELGNRRALRVRLPESNAGAVAFFESIGYGFLRRDAHFRLKDSAPEAWVVLECRLSPADPNPMRPTKPYLVLSADYEAARLARGAGIREAVK